MHYKKLVTHVESHASAVSRQQCCVTKQSSSSTSEFRSCVKVEGTVAEDDSVPCCLPPPPPTISFTVTQMCRGWVDHVACLIYKWILPWAVFHVTTSSLQPESGRIVCFDHITFWVGNAKQVCCCRFDGVIYFLFLVRKTLKKCLNHYP